MSDVKLGKARVEVVADTEKHDKSIDKSESRVKGFGQSVESMSLQAKAAWGVVGAGVAATTALVIDGTLEFGKWEQRLLRTESVLKATGYAVGFTTKELAEFAKQRDLATLGDKDGILDAINTLQTFKSVYGETFKRSIIASQDMAAVIGGDVKSQVIALGKALEDPVRGITALRRSGVSFTESQKDMIKGLVETNKLLEAQSLVLDAIEGQVGGAASGEASGLSGAIDTMNFRWREFKESLEQTESAVDGINAISKALEKTTKLINELDDPEKQLKTKSFWERVLGFAQGEKKTDGGISTIAAGDLGALSLIGQMVEQAETEWNESAKNAQHEREALAEREKAVQEKRVETYKKTQDELKKLAEKAFENWYDIAWSMSSYDEESTFTMLLKEDLEEQKRLSDDVKTVGDDIAANFRQSVQSGIGGVFSDTINADLHTSLDYVKSFAQMGGNIVGAGFSKAIMDSLSGVAVAGSTWAGLGVAGAGLFAVNSILNSSAKRKAEAARRAAIREQLADELGDSLAKLKLSDTGYEIYKLNDRLNDLAKSARESGYSMAEIIELRKLETAEILDQVNAKYSSITDSATDWLTGVQRESWTLTDWKTDQARLYGALESLDTSAADYQDESTEILGDILDNIKSQYQIEKQQLTELQGTSTSLKTQIWELNHSDGMAISAQDYIDRYDELRSAATTEDGNGFYSASAISDFQNFVQDYAETLSGLGFGSYADMVDGITVDLERIYYDVDIQMSELTAAIETNTESLTGSEGVVNAVNNLASITRSISNREVYNAWKDLNPANLPNETFESSISTSPAGLPSDQNLWVKTVYGGYSALDAYRYLDFINNAVQSTLDWAEQIDPSISPEVAEWLARGQDLFTLEPLTSVMQMDYNQDGMFDSRDQPLIDEWMAQGQAVLEWAKEINELNFPTFALGGLATGPSIFGEAGDEWGIPAYNNPNSENFIKSVGIDQVVNAMRINYESMGQAMAKHLAPVLAAMPFIFTGEINGKAFIRFFQSELDSNASLKQSIRRAALQ